ncbi:glutamate synthase subunit beta [Candidatus Margulisiibacteriota bacterium]
MGKTTGFLEYTRKEPEYRPVQERLNDYKDVLGPLSEDELTQQAARCMDCGVPFCHGLGCPLHNIIPEWNDLVYKGEWGQALHLLEKTNSLPEITSRVCPATCEAACTLSINDSPVTIKQIELAIIEYGFKNKLVKPIIPNKKIAKKIAVIGSGPAGLAAAISLCRFGYNVTVFEKASKLGGILRYGIPDFKLEKWVIDRRLELMKKSGIKFQTDVSIGEDISYRYLKKSFDVTLLTVGADEPRDLKTPGRELQGIHFAMDYLTQSNKFVAGDIDKKDIIWAQDKNVLVIGGGDTGSDCVGTANRQHAKKIYQFEIMPKPQEWKETWNPNWPDWPIILRESSSHKEGVQREWSILVKKFTGKNNKLNEVHCSRLEWKKSKENGSVKMFEIPKSDFVIKADLVFLAMGFIHLKHNKLIQDIGLKLDQKGNIKTDRNYATNIKNVFAAGDAGTGASLVVHAINQGQEAAKSINNFLEF